MIQSSSVWDSYADSPRCCSQLEMMRLRLVQSIRFHLTEGGALVDDVMHSLFPGSTCMQAADGRSPQHYMFALNRPTPVRGQFRVSQYFMRRSDKWYDPVLISANFPCTLSGLEGNEDIKLEDQSWPGQPGHWAERPDAVAHRLPDPCNHHPAFSRQR